MNTVTPTNNRKLSAANIVIRPADAKLNDLKSLIRYCGPESDRNELAITLVKALLDDGPRTGSELRYELVKLDFHREHVRKVLENNAGPSPQGSHWQRLDGDLYQAHT